MKKIPLLPRYFRWIGFLFVVISLGLYFLDSFRDRSDPGGIFIKTFVFINDKPLTPIGFFEIMEVDVLLTLIMLTMLLGLSCFAFTRRKVEDEMINSIRLYSWSWAVIVMIVLSTLVMIFVYGKTFVSFSFLFAHLLLLAYITIFKVNIWKMNRRSEHEE